MAFPKSLDELRNAHYIFFESAHCHGCGRVIEWWQTPRKADGTGAKMMPLDVTDGGEVVSHFATCPKVEQFRKRARP